MYVYTLSLSPTLFDASSSSLFGAGNIQLDMCMKLMAI